MATEFEQLRLSITLIDDASAGIKAVRAELRGTTGNASDYQKLIRDNTKNAQIYGDVVGYVDGRLVLLGGAVGYFSSKLDRFGSSLVSQGPAITEFARQQQGADQVSQLLGMSIGRLQSLRSQAETAGISQADATHIASSMMGLQSKLSHVGGRTEFQEMLTRSGFKSDPGMFRDYTMALSRAKDYEEQYKLIQQARKNLERYAIEQEGMDPELAREMGIKWLMLHGLPAQAVALEEIVRPTKEYEARQQLMADRAKMWLKEVVQLNHNIQSIKGQLMATAFAADSPFYAALQKIVKVTKWAADNAEKWFAFWFFIQNPNLLIPFFMPGAPGGKDDKAKPTWPPSLNPLEWHWNPFKWRWRMQFNKEVDDLTLGIQKVNLEMRSIAPGTVPAAFITQMGGLAAGLGAGTGYSGTQGLPGWLQTPGGGGRLSPTPGTGTGPTPGTNTGPTLGTPSAPRAPSGETPGAAPRTPPTPGTSTGGTPGTPSGEGGSYGGMRPQSYNYFQRQGLQPSAGDTTVIDTPYGKMTVNKDAASDFKGFYEELYKEGAPIRKAGSFNMRQKRWGGGWSSHAYGAATDLDDEVQLSPQMKAWIRANPERWERIKAKWNVGQPLTDDSQTGGKDPAHIEWRGPKPGPKPETPKTPEAAALPAPEPKLAEPEEPAKPAWPRTLPIQPPAEEGAAPFSPIPPGGLPKLSTPQVPTTPTGGGPMGRENIPTTSRSPKLDTTNQAIRDALRIPRLPSESDEAWTARGRRALEGARSGATAAPPGEKDIVLPPTPAPLPPLPPRPDRPGWTDRSGRRHYYPPGWLARKEVDGRRELEPEEVETIKGGGGVDRSVIDRSLQNEVSAKVNGDAKVSVDVSAPSKVGDAPEALFKKDTIERQTNMDDSERGPSVEVD